MKLTISDGVLKSIELPAEVPDTLNSTILGEIIVQLRSYKICFDDISEFTRQVWLRMMEIPAGKVKTYKELATVVGRPNAARAVGAACAANPLLLLVPCHRVVAVNGLGGYRGGLAWKEKLLELERVTR